MTSVLRIALLAVLSGCAIQPISTNPNMVVVQVDGKPVMVAKNRDGSWAATESAMPPIFMANPAAHKALLLKAVTIASKCAVVESHYNLNGGDIIAVVKCE